MNLAELSRAVSHALRHEPWLYELELDESGWTSVEALLVALRTENPAWPSLRQDDLVQMISLAGKRRYELNSGRIRALYGHSTPIKLKRMPSFPPSTLYHGTSPKAAQLIQKEGLAPMGRQYVHLSADIGTATEVGRRKSREPTIFLVDARQAHAAGIVFHQGNDLVWLADLIPPVFLSLVS